jgi:hypothetical protein
MSVPLDVWGRGDGRGPDGLHRMVAALAPRSLPTGVEHSPSSSGEFVPTLLAAIWPAFVCWFFASQTEIPEVMRAGGATGAPQITFYRKLEPPGTSDLWQAPAL